MNSTFDPLVGQVLDDRYEIVAKIARGGMATVYRARDLRLSRQVAIKVMRSDLGEDDEFAAKFDREARAAAVLSHPNVVSIFDQGTSDGKPYIVMEFIEGMHSADVVTSVKHFPGLGLVETNTDFGAAEDTEVGKFALRVCKRFSTKILTPRTFLTDLGPKQERVATYKELFYLHPSIFTPDRQKLRDAGFTPDEPYVLVRFVAWNASHDVGLHGLDDAGKLAFLKRLEKYGRVWLSSEAPLAPELEPYRLRTPYPLIHHVLAFARLVVSEGATMASEAAVLGTHALYINHIVSGSTREQSERYHLLDNFNDGGYDRALSRAEELLADPELEQKSHAQRDAMLADMIDINAYYLSETDRLARAGRHGKGAKSC